MNSDDWAKINMMTNLFSLDLSEAETEEIASHQFQTSKFPFFHAIKLPKNLKKIGWSAFYDSSLDEIELPASLEEIELFAFAGTYLKEVTLPDACTTLGTEVFSDCDYLKKITFPKSLSTIGNSFCKRCKSLQEVRLPENLTTIENAAFLNCESLDIEMPQSLQSIGSQAFQSTAIDTLRLPENVSYIDGEAFKTCNSLKYAELPVRISNLSRSNIFEECHNLRTLVLKSPTVVGGNKGNILYRCDVSQVTLKVPSYLVNAYKLDEVWYNYKSIEGFSTADIQDWTITNPLVLGARDRFEGQPNMKIGEGGSLKINGDKRQDFRNLRTTVYADDKTKHGQLWSRCDSVTIHGDYVHEYRVEANRWYFISLPFNFKVSDLTDNSYVYGDQAQYAIRRYDGAARAANGTGGSWKDCTEDEVIPAGTGFILQSNKARWYYFKALSDESKQYAVNNREFSKALAENASEQAAHRGWNLVGNPYPTFYNIHRLNFTAPITVWDLSRRTYSAYSIIDDDYALQPSQAFFVQCPAEVEQISFPLEGCQLTADIESQTAVRPMRPFAATGARRLFDLEISQADLNDRTRVVLNDAADEGYDPACDAAKFMSDDLAVPQLYTLDADETPLAINERPLADGCVRLGFRAGDDGSFTLRLARHDGGSVYLFDAETGTETDLAASDYHFTAKAGTCEQRFTLAFEGGGTTGLENAATGLENGASGQLVSVASEEGGISLEGHGAARVYAADGRLLRAVAIDGTARLSLPAGIYVVRAGAKAVKVSVTR